MKRFAARPFSKARGLRRVRCVKPPCFDEKMRASWQAARPALPGERTAAAAITDIARGAATALSPPIATAAIAAGAFALPFAAAGVLKIAYDLMVWRAFRHVTPPEEAGL